MKFNRPTPYAIDLPLLSEFYDEVLISAIEEINATKLLQTIKFHEMDLNYLTSKYNDCYKVYSDASDAFDKIEKLNVMLEDRLNLSDLEHTGHEYLKTAYLNNLNQSQCELAPLIKTLNIIIYEFNEHKELVQSSIDKLHKLNDYVNCISNDSHKLEKLFLIRNAVNDCQSNLSQCFNQIEIIKYFLEDAVAFQLTILNPFVVKNKALISNKNLNSVMKFDVDQYSQIEIVKKSIIFKRFNYLIAAPFIGFATYTPAFIILLFSEAGSQTGIGFTIFIMLLIELVHLYIGYELLFNNARLSYPATIAIFTTHLSIFPLVIYISEIELFFQNKIYLFGFVVLNLLILVIGFRKLMNFEAINYMLKLLNELIMFKSSKLTKKEKDC